MCRATLRTDWPSGDCRDNHIWKCQQTLVVFFKRFLRAFHGVNSRDSCGPVERSFIWRWEASHSLLRCPFGFEKPLVTSSACSLKSAEISCQRGSTTNRMHSRRANLATGTKSASPDTSTMKLSWYFGVSEAISSPVPSVTHLLPQCGLEVVIGKVLDCTLLLQKILLCRIFQNP